AACRLFGRHVVGRAQERSVLGERRALAVQSLGQAEVRDLGLVSGEWCVVSSLIGIPTDHSATYQEDVGRFQVAVDDLLGVRVFDGEGKGTEELRGRAGRL